MLTPYTGTWTFDEAAHLLRRTIYGPTKARISQAINDGLDATVTALLSDPAPVDPPVYFDFENDPEAGIGETWVDKDIDWDVMNINFMRAKTMWAWWFMQMHRNDQTITEKMTMFWHNHFVISGAGHANANWAYLNKLRDYSLGDFKELTEKITIDKSMLIYLNGTTNFATEPNENYARELLELFTLGKGELVAEGDYTTYTEQDVVAIARALTGWTAWSATNDPSIYNTWGHDTGDKILSHRFNGQVITNNGENEYLDVINIIFSKDEVAYHICRRLYMWFVHYDINDTVEAEVIAPMAQILLDNNYVIKPVMEALLKSEHFYDMSKRGAMIKNPLDYHFSSFNTLGVKPPTDILEEYRMWVGLYWEFEKLGMAIFEIPAVAGWPAYHQSPQFYRGWVNSASLTLRRRLYGAVNWYIRTITENTSAQRGYDIVNFIATLDNPLDVNAMIDEICQIVFARPMIQEQKDFFKQILIGNLPDFEWNDEYSNYLANPDDADIRQSVENKLRDMIVTMIGVPEFHLS